MEDERITDQITNNTVLGESQIVDKYSETGQQLEQGCKAASHEKPSAKQKPKTVASSQKRKEASDIVIKTEEEELEEEEEEEEEVEQDKNNEEEDSDMDREREKLKVGRKKAKKTKKTKKMKKPEMKDLMVGRRMASLNASAMMQVSTIGVKISIIHCSLRILLLVYNFECFSYLLAIS